MILFAIIYAIGYIVFAGHYWARAKPTDFMSCIAIEGLLVGLVWPVYAASLVWGDP